MKKLLLFLINIYQKNPFKTRNNCVFIPSCSQYTKESIVKYGALKGVYKGFKRIIRCHPWQKNHYDPLI